MLIAKLLLGQATLLFQGGKHMWKIDKRTASGCVCSCSKTKVGWLQNVGNKIISPLRSTDWANLGQTKSIIAVSLQDGYVTWGVCKPARRLSKQIPNFLGCSWSSLGLGR